MWVFSSHQPPMRTSPGRRRASSCWFAIQDPIGHEESYHCGDIGKLRVWLSAFGEKGTLWASHFGPDASFLLRLSGLLAWDSQGTREEANRYLVGIITERNLENKHNSTNKRAQTTSLRVKQFKSAKRGSVPLVFYGMEPYSLIHCQEETKSFDTLVEVVKNRSVFLQVDQLVNQWPGSWTIDFWFFLGFSSFLDEWQLEPDCLSFEPWLHHFGIPELSPPEVMRVVFLFFPHFVLFIFEVKSRFFHSQWLKGANCDQAILKFKIVSNYSLSRWAQNAADPESIL